jgi:dCTP deaminase
MERVTGIEPALSAWEADVLPLNYTRVSTLLPDWSPGASSGSHSTWFRTQAAAGIPYGVTWLEVLEKYLPRGVPSHRPSWLEEFTVILSDRTIRKLLAEGRLVVDPIDAGQIQPASVDVRLGAQIRVFRNHTAECIDPFVAQPDLTEIVNVPEGQPFVLHPGEFVLGSTIERVGLPDDIVARVDGKSSLGRWGVLIHATAGFVDAGFVGQITLELSSVATLPVKLWPGMKIGQISFMRIDEPVERPYGHPDLGSKYQGQMGPVASEYRRNVRPTPKWGA